MLYVNCFRHLEVYKLSRRLTNEIFEISGGFQGRGSDSIGGHMMRSSGAIGARIAQAWGHRKVSAHFIGKLTDADAEQLETQHWIEMANNCLLLKGERSGKLLNQCKLIGVMLNLMMAGAERFSIDGTEPVTDQE
jgi:four helix bundle protein